MPCMPIAMQIPDCAVQHKNKKGYKDDQNQVV